MTKYISHMSGLRSSAMVVMSAVLGLTLAVSSAHGEKPGDTLVSVDEVVYGPVSQTFPLIGRLIARRAGKVAARISGPVREIFVEVGDRVEKGAPIAALVSDRLEWRRRLRIAEVDRYKAAGESARALSNLRVQELNRLKKLRKSAAFSKARLNDKSQEVAQARGAVLEADAVLASAVANLRLAEIDLSYVTIRAPYSGVVSQRHTEVGAYVNTGGAVVSLIDNQHLEIEAAVPAEYVTSLRPGSMVTFRLDGEGAKTMNAQVRAMVPEENPLTRTRTVRFTPDLADAGDYLADSQSVTLQLPIGILRNAVTVDKDAILNRNGKNMVFVVGSNTADIRPVTLGQAVGDRFEVITGLAPGDVVVVRGNERLRPGENVRIRKKP